MKLTFSDKNKHLIVLPQRFRTSEVGAIGIDDVLSYDRPREVPALVHSIKYLLSILISKIDSQLT